MHKSLQKPEKKKALLLSFLFAAAVALVIFLPFLIVDKGFFLYAGDYNSQQIPFYMHVQQFLKSGGGTWDWATDLGGSIINSYGFYNLGSPFLWLTLPLPTSWMPYMMVPLFILKFACISAAATLYMLRYAKTPGMPVVAGVLYAFCGFNVYNIFFNHMLDPVVIFPLLLWALDGFMLEKKTGWFALFVGLALLNSYFFFIGNVVFLVLYFVLQCAMGPYRLSLPRFGQLALEALLGVGLGMALALPSLLSLLNNPRTDNFASGMNLVLYWNVQQIPAILSSLITPPDPPYLPNVFTEGAVKWTSMSAFLPIVSIAGVAGYLRSKKGGWLKWILGLSLVMALVPGLNSLFFAMNSSYYSRWYYMPILMMVLASLLALEHSDIDLRYGLRFTLAVTALWGLLGLVPTQVEEAWKLGVAQYASKFWLTWLTALFGIAAFAALWHFYRGKKRFASILLGAVMGFSAFYAVTHLSLGKFPQWEGDKYYVEQQYKGSAQLALPEDEGFYRIDTYSAYDNLALWLNKSGLQTFNSTVTPSIMEFYPRLGVKRDVSSKPEPKHYALRGLLGVRYTIVPLEDRSSFEGEVPGGQGWVYTGSQGSFAVYENENFLPLGFTYDDYILMDTLEAAYEDDRAPLLVRALGLSAEQAAEYGHLFRSELGGSYPPVSYESYTGDVAARRATASTSTWADASGFGAEISLPKENLVFFAVPYDPGFTATVDGEETEVLNISGGMMAVAAGAGSHRIVFTYKTPGFGPGLAVSLLCLLGLGLYWPLSRRLAKKRRGEGETEESGDALSCLLPGYQKPAGRMPFRFGKKRADSVAEPAVEPETEASAAETTETAPGKAETLAEPPIETPPAGELPPPAAQEEFDEETGK